VSERFHYSTSKLFNFAEGSYFERTSRPFYALIFLLPFILFYEVGTILINTDVLNQSQVRVVAFVWLQRFLLQMGFGSKFAWAAPAAAVVIILLGLQVASRKKWQFGFSDVWPMSVECILLAIPLVVLSLFLSSSVGADSQANSFQAQGQRIEVLAVQGNEGGYGAGVGSVEQVQLAERSLVADIVTGIGAGIYEELVFRLILICVLMVIFQDVLKFNKVNSVVLAVLVSAALFSAHHHIIFLDGKFGQAAAFRWPEFIFRTIAGVYFAVLFAIRGFGVTAGTHAFYDIIATVINVFFFVR